MEKCGQSIEGRRFLLLGKTETSKSAHKFSYGFSPASAKSTFAFANK